MFQLTTYDPSDDSDEPRQLPLARWLAGQLAGAPEFTPDPIEGVGFRLVDGGRALAEPTWADARSLALNCDAAASRLLAGEVALLRSTYPGTGVYVLLVPSHGRVSCALVTETPPTGDHFPYRPNLRRGTDAQVDAVHAWAAEQQHRLLGTAPLSCDRDALITALIEQASVAHRAAEALRLPTFG